MLDVMIIDDDAVIRERLKSMIQWEELNLNLTCEATDSDTARELYLLFRPQIIITDVCIPVISGLDLAEELLKLDPDIRFIVITGFNYFEYAQKAIRLRAVDLLSKPIFPEDIHKSLTMAIQYFQKEKAQFFSSISQNVKIDNHQILQCSFAADLLNGRFSNVFAARYIMDAIGLDSAKTNYASAVLDMLHKEKVLQKNGLPALPSAVQAQLTTGNIQAVCYMDEGELLHCLLATDLTDPDNLIEDLISQLREHMRLIADIDLQAGIGQTTKDLQQISKSHIQAITALNYLQLLSDTDVIHYKNIKRFEPRFTDLDSFQSYLTAQFRKNNLEELIVAIENHVYTLLGSSVDGLSKVSNFCVDYLLSIVKTSLSMGLTVGQLDGCGADLTRLSKQETPTAQLNFILHATKQLLSILFRGQNKNANHLVNLAKKYMLDHLSNENLDLDMVSDHVALSRIYFCKLFHKEVGISFNNYLKDMRIERAKELLTKTTMRVFEVSSAVGFSSAKYFGYVFRREVGLSPLEYQRSVSMHDA